MDTLHAIWHQATTIQPVPPLWLTLLTIALALGLVLPGPVWPVTRNVVTIAHEGGHAIVARLVGRKLAGIRLHSDTSGVTVSAGKPTGIGMILTAAAGYTAPGLLGLLATSMVGHGRIAATLWATTVLLAVMLLLIRNLYGALIVILTGAAVVAVSWYAPQLVQTGFACLLGWFLLAAGLKPVWELHLKRRLGQAPDSDADQLARLSGIPGIFWMLVFAAVNLGSLGYSVWLLFV